MSQQPQTTGLTPEESELLSAWMDGQTSAAEESRVTALLAREDGRARLEELKRTRALVAQHALTSAPTDLAQRVKASTSRARIHQLPQASWRTVITAVAAALLVAAGIMFGPVLFSPTPAPQQQVASDGFSLLANDDASGPAVEARKSEAWAAGPASEQEQLEKLNEVGRSQLPDPEHAKPAAAKADGAEENAAKANDAAQGRRGLAGGVPKPQADGQADRDARRQEDLETLKDRKSGEAIEPTPPSMPADEPNALRRRSDSGAEGGSSGPARARGSAPAPGERRFAQVRVVDWSTGQKLAAQTDALWVGALYGRAELADEPGTTESVRVHVSQDRVQQLVDALSKLAISQGYSAGTESRDKGAAAEDYLPAAPEEADGKNEVQIVVRIR